MRKKPPYMVREKDRHGKVRWYFRRKNGKRVVLPGAYGSEEFMAAYRAALAGTVPPPSRHKAQTIGWLFAEYAASQEFRALAPRTRRVRKNLLDGIAQRVGDKPIDAITSKVIRASRDDRADKVEAANAFLKVMRAVFKWAAAHEHVPADPAKDVPYLKAKGEGWTPWTARDVAAYRTHWQIGTKERLAFELLYHTGLRRSDLVRLGQQHVSNGVIEIPTAKTGETAYIEANSELMAILEASPTGDTVFFVTQSGKPYSSDGFGNWFRRKCRAAGLEGLSAHGIRKRAAVETAESGATEHELMAQFAWASPKQAARYTRSASRKKLAQAAGKKRSAKSGGTD